MSRIEEIEIELGQISEERKQLEHSKFLHLVDGGHTWREREVLEAGLDSREEKLLAEKAELEKAHLPMEKRHNPMFNLGRSKQQNIATYILAKIQMGGFEDPTDGCQWVVENCEAKSKPIKFNSIYKVTSNLNSITKFNMNDARKEVEEFEKKFGIKME